MQLTELVRSWFRPTLTTPALAEDVLRSLWKKTVRTSSTHHPFHREILPDLDTLVSRVTEAPAETLVEVNGVPTRWDAMPQRHPRIYQQFTPEWMRGFGPCRS